jgi:ankyrin repeat protein
MAAGAHERHEMVARFGRALWQGDAKVVAALLAKVPPNGEDRWHQTPLSMAAQYGDLATVEALVRRGAAVDQRRVYLTPLTFAARRAALDVVAFLRAAGATESVVTSVYLGDRAALKRALREDGARVHVRDEEGTPLLQHAAWTLDVDLAVVLLNAGARIDDASPDGGTALHVAADRRRAEPAAARAMVTLLLDRGAAVNARNWDEVTPLHQAVRARNLGAVEVLLARGADANARDRGRGSTPLRRAVSPTGASATAGTNDLMLPLTKLLLAHGADPDATDKRGVSVRDSARDPAIIALLQAHRPARAAKEPVRKPATKPRKR